VLAAWLHEQYTGQIALAATPLQAARLSTMRRCAALLLSAGGRNPDILGVFKALLVHEPRALGVLCLVRNSPLAKLCRRYEFVSCAEFEVPTGKDGFVATNSLLALGMLLWRSYAHLTGKSIDEHLTLEQLLEADSGLQAWTTRLGQVCEALWTRPNLIVLHGAAATQAAALDLESKFSEAAIGPVQVTDYRNFAHGRHHWLDKKGQETGLLAFVSDEDVPLAEKTLRLLPKDIPVARIRVPGSGAAASIAGLVCSLYVVGYAGQARGIDPGRPGVPEFGRRIYNLNAWSSKIDDPVPANERLAIERKTCRPLSALGATEVDYWREQYRHFIRALHETLFDAIVLDYDGTLCNDRFRFTGLPPTVSQPLNSLLADGVLLGIATGRGKSVRTSLRDSIDKKLWPQVVIAYHNGSEIGGLECEGVPPENSTMEDEIREAAVRIRESHAVNAIGVCEYKRSQISIVAQNPADTERLYSLVCDLIATVFREGVSCVRSAHSVDVLAPGVSKLSLLDALRQKLLRKESTFLCIGDLGSWPGNDFFLLSTPLSLSANDVSSVPDRCWNLAPPGLRNSQATRFFLRMAKVSKGRIRLDCRHLLVDRREGA
jgi:hydroxymethylpyrimidine pyrophosphatase-like HAD family hydrolase